MLGQLTRVLLWTDGTGLEPDWHVYQVRVYVPGARTRTSGRSGLRVWLLGSNIEMYNLGSIVQRSEIKADR